jgi:hypothetical protein
MAELGNSFRPFSRFAVDEKECWQDIQIWLVNLWNLQKRP